MQAILRAADRPDAHTIFMPHELEAIREHKRKLAAQPTPPAASDPDDGYLHECLSCGGRWTGEKGFYKQICPRCAAQPAPPQASEPKP
jgi:hypothetical protein